MDHKLRAATTPVDIAAMRLLLDEVLRRASLPVGLTPEQIETLREALAVNGVASLDVPSPYPNDGTCRSSCPLQQIGCTSCLQSHSIQSSQWRYHRPGPSCPWTRARERKGE